MTASGAMTGVAEHDPEPKDRVSEKWRPVFATLTFGSEEIMLKQEIKQ
jgi:hypothetical protein